MSKENAKVGLAWDLFDTNGRPMFGDAVLSLFSDAGIGWSVLSLVGGQLPAAAFTDYEGLLIGGSNITCLPGAIPNAFESCRKSNRVICSWSTRRDL